ncbi:hypothetical protein ARMSODRAFT_839449, partial [Armillaria solidipes]
IIRPIPPTPYDGMADGEKFHRFTMEMTQFCKEGQVPKDEQVFLTSHYLKGKALLYFIQKVSKNHAEWMLLDFLRGMFNACFPLNYRSQQRDKIKRCYQNDRTVSEYVYELKTLYGLVGITSKRERVIKLWDGFRKEMQRELHRAKLNKEVHSWRRI